MAGPLLALPSPFTDEPGVICLAEPPDTPLEGIRRRLLNGQYDKPFVLDDGETRSLHFSLAYTQSLMRVDAPDALCVGYTRKMMSFLLFHPQPRHLLMLGLGGGSLAKFCHRHLPQTRLTAVEIDRHVLAFRDLFRIPPDDSRFRVVQADAADYVERCSERPDVILLDAFDRHGLAASVGQHGFYESVHDALDSEGLLVANLAGRQEDRYVHLDMIHSVFEGNALILSVGDSGNNVVLAFRDPDFTPSWHQIQDRSRSLQCLYGLDFPGFAAKLARSHRLDYARRILDVHDLS